MNVKRVIGFLENFSGAILLALMIGFVFSRFQFENYPTYASSVIFSALGFLLSQLSEEAEMHSSVEKHMKSSLTQAFGIFILAIILSGSIAGMMDKPIFNALFGTVAAFISYVVAYVYNMNYEETADTSEENALHSSKVS